MMQRTSCCRTQCIGSSAIGRRREIRISGSASKCGVQRILWRTPTSTTALCTQQQEARLWDWGDETGLWVCDLPSAEAGLQDNGRVGGVFRDEIIGRVVLRTTRGKGKKDARFPRAP